MNLTNPELPISQRQKELKRFADENSWLPSDEIIEYPGTESFSNGHLIVEHGLDNTAVITFLKSDRTFKSLSEEEKIRLLSISYNNLVDVHFFPDPYGLTLVFNRIKSISEATKYISRAEEEQVWRAEAFERIVGRLPNPNLKSLDDALMETISIWKRVLASELGSKVGNENISALFNSLLFVRALEDDIRHREPNKKQILIERWTNNGKRLKTIGSCIAVCIKSLGIKNIPKWLFEEEKLSVFDSLDREIIFDLFNDFCRYPTRNHIVRDVFSNHSTRCYYSVFPNGYAW